jgi:hypothetical protein
MDARQGGGFASCPFSSLGCGLRVSFRWRLVAGESFVLGASRGGSLCPNTHRVASHVRPPSHQRCGGEDDRGADGIA